MFEVPQDSPWAELLLFPAFTQTEQQPKSPLFVDGKKHMAQRDCNWAKKC